MEENKELNIKGADIAIRIEHILQKLTACIEAETNALRAHDRDVANKLMKEKKALLVQYKSLHDELVASTKDIDMADPDIRAYLKKTVAKFDRTLKENAIVITTGKKAATRLLTRILSKARETIATSTQNYNAQGYLVKNTNASLSNAVKLNETL